MGILPACVSLSNTCMANVLKSKKRVYGPHRNWGCRQLLASMWMLGTEPMPSGRTATALNPWAISLAPVWYSGSEIVQTRGPKCKQRCCLQTRGMGSPATESPSSSLSVLTFRIQVCTSLRSLLVATEWDADNGLVVLLWTSSLFKNPLCTRTYPFHHLLWPLLADFSVWPLLVYPIILLLLSIMYSQLLIPCYFPKFHEFLSTYVHAQGDTTSQH